MLTLTWRPPSPDDTPDWAELLDAIEAVDQRGETYTPEDLDDEWESVWSHPETDSVFVWEGPELVGFGWLKTQVGTAKGHRVDCWGGVRPSHRGRGIGRALLDWQVRRASDVATGLAPDLDARIGLDAADHQTALLALARRAGFEPVRRFLEVARSVAAPLAGWRPVERLELVAWAPELDEATRAAHADSFVDHWGSEPRTQEEWRQWYTGHRAFRPDLSLVALEPTTGEVAAFVLCAAYPQDWEAGTAPIEAWVTSVGTRQAWRGRGAARWVLSEVLARIAASASGFERAILGVDADNPTGALGLYRSLGFEDVRAVTYLTRPPR